MPGYIVAIALAVVAFVAYNIGFYRGHKDGEKEAQYKLGLLRRFGSDEKKTK